MIEPVFEEDGVCYSLSLLYNTPTNNVRLIDLASWFGFKRMGVTEETIKIIFKTQEEAILFKQMVDDGITP